MKYGTAPYAFGCNSVSSVALCSCWLVQLARPGGCNHWPDGKDGSVRFGLSGFDSRTWSHFSACVGCSCTYQLPPHRKSTGDGGDDG